MACLNCVTGLLRSRYQLKHLTACQSWRPRARSLGRLLSQTGAVPQKTMTTEATVNPTVVYVTVPDNVVAKQISHGLVEGRLAACVNIIPGIRSVYLWQGKMNEDAELLLMIKTRSDLIERLTHWVQSHHPYDECEVISVPITGGSQSYLEWIQNSTH